MSSTGAIWHWRINVFAVYWRPETMDLTGPVCFYCIASKICGGCTLPGILFELSTPDANWIQIWAGILTNGSIMQYVWEECHKQESSPTVDRTKACFRFVSFSAAEATYSNLLLVDYTWLFESSNVNGMIWPVHVADHMLGWQHRPKWCILLWW